MGQKIYWKMYLKKWVNKGKSHYLFFQTVQKFDEFVGDALILLKLKNYY